MDTAQSVSTYAYPYPYQVIVISLALAIVYLVVKNIWHRHQEKLRVAAELHEQYLKIERVRYARARQLNAERHKRNLERQPNFPLHNQKLPSLNHSRVRSDNSANTPQ
jgi:hypothetical protein